MKLVMYRHPISNHRISFKSNTQFREVVDNTPKMTVAKRVALHRSNRMRKLLRIVLD